MVAARAGAICAWLVVWNLASVAVGQPLILPGPAEVAGALLALVVTPAFWAQVGFSATRILGALVAAYACALALAAASRASRVVRELVRVPLSAIKATPVVCVVVLLLIWLGSANVSVAAVFLMALPGLYFPVLEGLDAVAAGGEAAAVAEVFDVHGVRGLTRALGCAWPRVLPFVVAASETVVGMSWKAGVAAELIGVPSGSVGERIYQAKLLLETGSLFAWTIAVVAIATACERLIAALLRASGPACVALAARLRGTGERAFCPTNNGTEGSSFCPRGGWTARDLVLAHGSVAPLTYEAPAGARVCVMAPSGTGKTTLLRTLAGLEPPAAGECAAPRASLCPQGPSLVPCATVEQNVLLTAAPQTNKQQVRALLGELLPEAEPASSVAALSGGQRRRVELARALCAPGDLVLLDEPFAGLDEKNRELACAVILRELRGRSLVVATHDAHDADLLDAATLELVNQR